MGLKQTYNRSGCSYVTAMEGDNVGGTDIVENHDFMNGDINKDLKSAKNGINNNIEELHAFDVKEEEELEGEEGEPDTCTMGEPGLVNMALDKIGQAEVDVFGDDLDEPVIERKAYSNPELRDIMLHPRVTGYNEDGPMELTEDEYQEFLEDSECLVENGDVEPVAQDCDDPHGDLDEPHGDIDEPIEVENETGLKKLAPNMGDISPLDEYPPLGGFHGFGDSHGIGDPDGLSDCSDIDEPREGSPEPDMCYPPHAPAHEYLDPPSSDDEDLMPADTADSMENGLNDSVEKEAVAELRNKSKNKEDEEDNFVLTAMIDAVEAGDLNGMKELLDTANHYDVNLTNKHGETVLLMACGAGQLEIVEYLHSKGANLNVLDKNGDNAVYWAARQGHVDVIKFLKDQAVTIDMQNNAGEAPIHVAARYGHNTVIDYLCSVDADVNLQDKLLETPLHNACWHGMPAQTCLRLCAAGARVDAINKEGETPLHCAAARGNLECVRVLIDNSAPINATDRRGSTALHMACRRHHVGIALVLLHHGCQFDVVDHLNETPLHIAAKEGILPIVQTLCAFGCKLEILSRGGMTPLHLASKGGHLEVVRCLLLSGAEPDLPNKDGITAEIMALAQGQNEIAELLTKLKPVGERREVFMKQLMPTSTPLCRVKIKLFGHSGSGKSTLADSLKCGYFGSFFRKARLSSSTSVATDGGVTKNNGHADVENRIGRHHSLPSQLSYDVRNHSYTHGIDVHNVTLTGSGDVSIWDFSGYEPYFMLYDHFIGDPNAIHVITFSLAEPHATQLAQVLFWMNFLKARIPPFEPIGPGGKHPWPARVLLVATHADKAGCAKNNKGEFVSDQASLVMATVLEKFALDFDISQHVLVVDAHLAMSPDLKTLRTMLGEIKNDIVQVELQNLPCANGFLDAVVATLPTWRKTTANFPVLPWPHFIDLVRSKVNMLASEEHMKELIQQLQILGEVIYLETADEHDLVVLDGKWLGTEVIGHLLSHETILNARPTGCFTTDDFQLIFPDAEAKDILQVLEALEVCTKCENDGEVEYEFPCLNFVERLHGLWEKDIKRYPNAVYGGLRIQCPRAVPSQMSFLFPRIQTALRRHMINEHNSPYNDLYQWHHGSKYCSGYLESFVTLEQDDMVIEVKARGPQDMRTNLFYFFEEVCQVITQVMDDSCPGLDYERHILSPTHLKAHAEAPHSYAPSTLLRAQLNGETSLKLEDSADELFTDVVTFGSDEIKEFLCLGIDLHVSHLSLHTRRHISTLLDPPDPMGRDWCLLAVSLGLTETLPSLDENSKKRVDSRTDRSLEEWSRDSKATILTLIGKLRELGRDDAIDLVLQNSPTYKVFPDQDASREESPTGAVAPSHSSNNTLSSVSR